jgi:predicted aspartyl protease
MLITLTQGPIHSITPLSIGKASKLHCGYRKQINCSRILRYNYWTHTSTYTKLASLVVIDLSIYTSNSPYWSLSRIKTNRYAKYIHTQYTPSIKHHWSLSKNKTIALVLSKTLTYMKNNRTGVIEDPYIYEKQSHWCYRRPLHIRKTIALVLSKTLTYMKNNRTGVIEDPYIRR